MAWIRRCRDRLSDLGLTYVVGVTGALMCSMTVWPPGREPLPPAQHSGRGVVPTRQRLGQARHQRPQSIKELALELNPSQWQSIEWREGSNFTLRSRFARVRVRAAYREHQRTQMRGWWAIRITRRGFVSLSCAKVGSTPMRSKWASRCRTDDRDVA